MPKKSRIIKSNRDTSQLDVEEDYVIDGNGIVEPFVSYAVLRQLYVSNLYHQRAIKLKAGLLSQAVSTTITPHLPPGTNIKSFLYRLVLNLETYGSAFVEKAGTKDDYYLYNMDSYHSRVATDHSIHQFVGMQAEPIEALHVKYDSILSAYYGEPDYITIIRQIASLTKADLYNDKFFDNGGKPELAFIFEDSDPSDEQVEAISSFVNQSFGGYQNSHKNLILTTGEGNGETKPKIRIEQIGKVEDLSFEKLKAVGRDEIATAHGVPPRLLGIVQGSGLGGSGELVGQMQMFLATTINPRLELLEWFFSEHHLELTLERFDIETLNSNAEVADELVRKGIITAIEKTQILG